MNPAKPASSLSRWRALFRRVVATPTPLLVGSVLSLASALFEGVSAGLLIPTLEGALKQDFQFLREIGPVESGLESLPAWVSATDARLFGLLLGTVFLAVLLKLAANYAAGLYYAHALWRLMHRMKLLCMDRFMGFGKRFFDQHNAGHLRNLLLSHPAHLIAIANSAKMALYWACSLVAYVGLMVAISWRMTIVVVILFPLLYLSLNGLVRRIRATSEAYAAANRAHHEHASNLLSCMPLVLAMNQEARERAQFEALSARSVELELSQARKQLLVYPLQESIVTTAVLVLVIVGALLFTGDTGGSLSGFLVFFYLLKRSATSFTDLNRLRGVFSSQSGLLDEMLDLFDDEGKPFVTSGPTAFEGLEREITLNDLKFSYGSGTPALNGVTCRFEKGKTTAVVGRTGSGKSTLVSLLMRFYEVDPGAISVDGLDIRELDVRSLRRHIAYVSQDTVMLNDTIRANITYGLDREVSEEELGDVVSRARLDELVGRQSDGLETLVGDRGVMVSGGEKQRIAIARAMLKGAEILVLDEATSSLDSRTEELVQAAIDESLEGRTAIVIAHRLSTIKNADWILLLEDGRLEEEGTLDALIAKDGAFRSYWDAQGVSGGDSLDRQTPAAYDAQSGAAS